MPTEILTADQYLTEDWHQLRRNGISASEVAVVMGLSPFMTPFALYHNKVGDWRTPVTEAMEMGHKLEPFVADLLAERLGDSHVLTKVGTWQADYPKWALATPDRLAQNEMGDENVELKSTTVFDGWGPDESDEVPVHYQCQAQWQMLCTDTAVTHFGVLFKGSHFRHYTLPRSDADINIMVAKGKEFMARLRYKNPPPVDEGASTLAVLKHLHPEVDPDETVMIPADLAREYREAHNDTLAAESRKSAAENRIRYLAGSAKRIVDEDGVAVATRSVYQRRGYAVQPTTIDQLRSA